VISLAPLDLSDAISTIRLQTFAEKQPYDYRIAVGALQTEGALWDFCNEVLGIEVPFRRCCSGHVSPFDAMAHSYFAYTPNVLWHASRGLSGKSFTLALLCLVELITLGVKVNLLGGSGQQAERVHDYLSGADPAGRGKFWDADHAPKWLLKGAASKYKTELLNRAILNVLMASDRSIRGPHPVRLRVDECLVGETLVSTPLGDQRLDSLCPGDVTYCWGEGRLETSPVGCFWERGNRRVIRLDFSDGSHIVCTPDHPVLRPDGSWVSAEEVQEVLTLEPARVLKVTGISEAGHQEVYDISTKWGTFIANGVVVHNCDSMSEDHMKSAQGQTMDVTGLIGAQTTWSSTWQRQHGTFTRLMEQAEEKGWPILRWCMKETVKPYGWLPPSEVIRKREDVSEDMWRTEYELNEPSSEDLVIARS